MVNGATTALEERENVSFVLSEEFVGGVVRLGTQECLEFWFSFVDDFVDGCGHVKFDVDCGS